MRSWMVGLLKSWEFYSIRAAEGQNPRRLRLLAKRVLKDRDDGV